MDIRTDGQLDLDALVPAEVSMQPYFAVMER